MQTHGEVQGNKEDHKKINQTLLENKESLSQATSEVNSQSAQFLERTLQRIEEGKLSLFACQAITFYC